MIWFLVWYAFGVAGFFVWKAWWTQKYDVTLFDFIAAIFLTLLGPVNLISSTICYLSNNPVYDLDTVIFKKKS